MSEVFLVVGEIFPTQGDRVTQLYDFHTVWLQSNKQIEVMGKVGDYIVLR